MDAKTYKWNKEHMLEVTLSQPDDFLKVRETLTRIGVSSRSDMRLYQSCHILHKQGKYYIVHFKELFALDGKPTNISVNDIERRDAIAVLLQEWGLVSIVKELQSDKSVLSQIKIVPYKEKSLWELIPKYSIGTKVKPKTD